jgi:S1-C subfamily serine protease
MKIAAIGSVVLAVVSVACAMARPEVESARAGVVQVVGKDGDGSVQSTGSGFVVERDGRYFVVTTFQVLRNRRGAVALPASDGSAEIALEPLVALPERDLAVLRPAEPAALADAGARPLILATSARLGQDAWAVGYQRESGFAESPGIVRGVRLRDDFPDADRPGGVAPDTSLCQTDAEVGREDSGGPLLNESGEVLGVLSFALSEAQGVSLAVSARHVEGAIASLPLRPIGFEAFRVGVVPEPAREAARPPGLDTPRDKPSTLLNAAAAGLKRGIICTRCEGTGTVKQKKQTGVDHTGPNQTRPVFAMVDVECSTCGASRVQKPPAVRSQLIKVMQSLAVVEEDEKYLERLFALRDLLRERVAPVAGSLRPILMDWYRDLARRPQSDQIGEVLVAFGSVKEMIDHETFWIESSTAGPLVVRDTRLVHTLDKEKVMIGGLIAGFEKSRGSDATVLQHGLVVSY